MQFNSKGAIADPDKNPRIFFRFRSCVDYACSEIQTNLVYQSPPEKLNDPLDCTPIIGSSGGLEESRELVDTLPFLVQLLSPAATGEEEIDQILKDIYKKTDHYSEFSKNPEPCASKRYANALREEIEFLLNKKKKEIRVVCFTKDWKNSRMWGQYANHHKGVCIAYEFSEERDLLKKVEYKPSRAISLSRLQEMTRAEDSSKSLIDYLFFEKTIDWKDENEYRIVSHPEQAVNLLSICRELESTKESNLIPLPAEVRAILFGVNCKPEDRKKIWEAVQNLSLEDAPDFYDIEFNRSLEKDGSILVATKLTPEELNFEMLSNGVVSGPDFGVGE